MKTLIAFYSRTGNTKKVGVEIARILKADIDEIIDKKDRSGIKGWLGGGKDALFKKSTEIENKKDASEYEIVVVGTPVWVNTMTPAVKVYLSKYKFNEVAFFCTYGGSKGRCFKNMEKLTKKPVAVFGVKDKLIDKSMEKIREFCERIK
ncbi:MAG: flavodoxin [Nanoarchaeota archaeon]|nr:flavodoxin [Nanoarchaeota archaeon]